MVASESGGVELSRMHVLTTTTTKPNIASLLTQVTRTAARGLPSLPQLPSPSTQPPSTFSTTFKHNLRHNLPAASKPSCRLPLTPISPSSVSATSTPEKHRLKPQPLQLFPQIPRLPLGPSFFPTLNGILGERFLCPPQTPLLLLLLFQPPCLKGAHQSFLIDRPV